MDAQALLTPDAVEQAMGRPLAHVPDPAGDGHDSYARHFAGLFLDTFERLGVQPDRVYWMSEVYAAGEMDRYIRVALDRADVVRDIYRRVANVRHPDEWQPLSVICENCGRVGTTIVTAWDGERGRTTSAVPTWWPGPPAAAMPATSRPSAAAPSCRSTSTGRRSGACSA